MAASRLDAASASLAGPLSAKISQPATKWLVLAGVGSVSALLASRFAPSLLPSNQPDKGDKKSPTSPPPPSTTPTAQASSTSIITSSVTPTTSRSKKDRVKDEAIPVAIFWDVDNCAPPTGSSGRSVALAVRKSIQSLEVGPIVSFKAYLELSSETNIPNAAQVQLRSELQGCGVSLIDTPKSGRKDVADKMMITDLLAFAIDQPAPATIVLISGDRDFAYPLGLLRNRGYEVVLIVPPIGAVPILEASANVVLTWRQDVLGIERNQAGKPYSNYTEKSQNIQSDMAADPHQQQNSSTALPPDKPPGALRHHDRRPSNRTLEVFRPLISLLEQLRKEGVRKPLRSTVAARLIQMDRGLFVRAGASRWAEYAAVAEAAGIVTLGASGGPGTEWVSLTDTSRPPTKTLTASPTPSTAPNTIAPSRNKVTAPAPPQSNQHVTLHRDQRAFLPLIEICKERKAQGDLRPLCSYVGVQLSLMAKKGGPDPYVMAGVSSWKEYIAAAERVSVARTAMTDKEGVLSVAVNPIFLNAQINPVNTTSAAVRDGDFRSAAPSSLNKNATTGTLTASLAKRPMMDSTPKGGFTGSAPSVDASDATHVHFNGVSIPHVFGPICELLQQQISEGRPFSTDYFVQSILGSSRAASSAPGNVRSADEFHEYLETAVAMKIITTEPGLKPGVRHIRLHPRLVRPIFTSIKSSQSSHTASTEERDSDAWEDDEDSVETEGLLRGKSKTCSQLNSHSTTLETPRYNERQVEALRKETSEKLASLSRTASSEGSTASGPVPHQDSVRFGPLLKGISAVVNAAASDASQAASLATGIPKVHPRPLLLSF
ncbi:hypothetical protein BCV70DRAFT_198901 [Testicularia cyperi]|uniref:NYN domain-containing protein n=1 Tax=Testicularia cyperi TaxID=1882483 RepID=A0A317XVY5_9BASI|nr:hypothetical protein BCV70DRAFT_198901 [Testicularia cyperi]